MKLIRVFIDRNRTKNRRQEGQSLVEASVTVVFLLLIILVTFEFGRVFFTYLNVLSAARAGALYASNHPEWLANLSTDSPEYVEYSSRIIYEIRGAGLDTTYLSFSLPEVDTVEVGAPVRVTVTYELSTFTSGMRFPFFGRFGLPSTYKITASVEMPIRGGG